MKREREELDRRWDVHTDRQLSASKAGIAAITVLNSGSWLALLTQASALTEMPNPEAGSRAIFAWGTGALLGTSIWLFLYLATVLQGMHDFNRSSRLIRFWLDSVRLLGLSCSIASGVCFYFGVLALADLFLNISPE